MPTGDPDRREVVSGRDVSLVRTVGGLLRRYVPELETEGVQDLPPEEPGSDVGRRGRTEIVRPSGCR